MKTELVLKPAKHIGSKTKSAIGNRQSAMFLCLLLAGFSAVGQSDSSPFLIPFQGRLTNPQGLPYTNGQYTVIFNLYDQPVGGTVSWSETHEKIGVINGMVNLFLGSINPALSNVDFSQTRYLGITIDADGNPNTPDPEMVPRQMIIPAFWAKNSEKLNGYDWTPIFGANNPTLPLPGAKIQNSSITSGQISPHTITAEQIANSTITAQQLADAIITSNQIVNGSISSANLAIGAVLTANIADGQVTLQKLAPRQTFTNVVGVGGMAISPDCGDVSGNAGPGFNVPNLSVTITTTGRPVWVGLIPTVTNSESHIQVWLNSNIYGGFIRMYVGFLRGTNSVAVQGVGGPSPYAVGGGVTVPVSSFQTIDMPPGGTWTYTVQVSFGYASTYEIEHARLVAYEL